MVKYNREYVEYSIDTSEDNRKQLEERLSVGLDLHIPKFEGPPHIDELLVERLIGYLFYQSEPTVLHPEDSKVVTKHLKQALTAVGFRVTHTKCLEITSQLYGCKNWNELCHSQR